jgi:cytochrome b6-f complex iron-sulfur subunit
MNQTEKHPEAAPMKRGEFLRSLGLSSAALMAFYCMGTLTSCSNSGDDPTPGNPTNPGGNTKVDFTLDLNAAANANLKEEGGFITQGNVIVARVKGGSYVALAKNCTHEGTQVAYQLANDRFNCPNHGSNFKTDGTVINGPATTALKAYKTTLSGTNLRVSE